MSDLIQQLGQIEIVDYYIFKLKTKPEALRDILLAVAEEMPQFVEHFWSKVPDSRKLTDDIDFEEFSNWLAQELIALAETLSSTKQ